MKIICAGYPKTGSKSCSGALRVLGFKVADWLETAEFFGSTWRDYIDEKYQLRMFWINIMSLDLMQIKITLEIFYGKNFILLVPKDRFIYLQACSGLSKQLFGLVRTIRLFGALCGILTMIFGVI